MVPLQMGNSKGEGVVPVSRAKCSNKAAFLEKRCHPILGLFAWFEV